MYIAIDIGGTSTRVASSNSIEEIEIINKLSWTNSHVFEIDYQKIVDQIYKLDSKIEAIGIGVPGEISPDKKTVFDTSWNHEWENQGFVDKFSNEFNCPVFLENDGLVASLGVAYYGEGKNNDFAYVTWGTGIGGALIVEGEANKLDWDEYFKEWESKCGGRKIEQRFNKTADKLSESEWQQVMADFKSELELFKKKINQSVVIFGGGASVKQKERLLAIDQDIHVSKLGEDIGLYGGFALIRQNLNDNKE